MLSVIYGECHLRGATTLSITTLSLMTPETIMLSVIYAECRK
jgi:hypothetical protein